ncbi:GNAT family N-acetyltransferase [Halobacteriales archaeon SW_8_68_21]|nr:MAG: GNAT family N-acetyltransferase [Halobacteriales archaeon SW_8_68_21]
MPSITLTAVDDDVEYVERLLERNGLPTGDLRDSPAAFYVAEDGGERIGVGGIEAYGDAGLLRSVVVEASRRESGYGSAVCDALEAEAREAGIETLYLLTTTAAGFFAARGYAAVERSEAPDAIRDTAEFAELCPSSAACMRKSLA